MPGQYFDPRLQAPGPYQSMNDPVPRFFATPEEKAFYQGHELQHVDFSTIYPDSFVSVVVDGNRFQVSSAQHQVTRTNRSTKYPW